MTKVKSKTKREDRTLRVVVFPGARTDLVCPEDDCTAVMVLRASKYGPFYGCKRYPKCKSTHGAHPDGAPLGIPASTPTKRARMMAHAAFDVLWKSKDMQRNEAYGWLAKQMGRNRGDTHIGEFNQAQCAHVLLIVATHYGLHYDMEQISKLREQYTPKQMEPRWHCVCTTANIPAYKSECDSCGRPKPDGTEER
jgi:ssDNA-binding Zn-finger/Zn-ribbon topoisomerase 1